MKVLVACEYESGSCELTSCRSCNVRNIADHLISNGSKDVRRLLSIPAADVAPVVHGRWIRPHWKNSNYCCDCSECGGEAMHRDYQWHKNVIYPICPNCGERMDGGDDGETN